MFQAAWRTGALSVTTANHLDMSIYGWLLHSSRYWIKKGFPYLSAQESSLLCELFFHFYLIVLGSQELNIFLLEWHTLLLFLVFVLGIESFKNSRIVEIKRWSTAMENYKTPRYVCLCKIEISPKYVKQKYKMIDERSFVCLKIL